MFCHDIIHCFFYRNNRYFNQNNRKFSIYTHSFSFTVTQTMSYHLDNFSIGNFYLCNGCILFVRSSIIRNDKLNSIQFNLFDSDLGILYFISFNTFNICKKKIIYRCCWYRYHLFFVLFTALNWQQWIKLIFRMIHFLCLKHLFYLLLGISNIKLLYMFTYGILHR